MSSSEADAEQRYVDVLYARLDLLRDRTDRELRAVRRAGASGTPQARSERDAFATLYEDRLVQLSGVEERLCFGRLDMSDRVSALHRSTRPLRRRPVAAARRLACSGVARLLPGHLTASR